MNVPPEAGGRSGKCPACGEKVRIPLTAFANAVDKTPSLPPDLVPAAHPSSAAELQPAHFVIDTRAVRTVRPRHVARASHSLGIASMVLGILGFMVCWVPLLGLVGLPLSGLGVLLGTIGLATAIARGGIGIGFPIGGLAISLLAVATAVVAALGQSPAVKTQS